MENSYTHLRTPGLFYELSREEHYVTFTITADALVLLLAAPNTPDGGALLPAGKGYSRDVKTNYASEGLDLRNSALAGLGMATMPDVMRKLADQLVVCQDELKKQYETIERLYNDNERLRKQLGEIGQHHKTALDNAYEEGYKAGRLDRRRSK